MALTGRDLYFTLMVFVLALVLERTESYMSPCSNNEFRCFNGECIRRYYFCNGQYNCQDNSDEFFCNIPTNYSSCSVGIDGYEFRRCLRDNLCYPREWQCDGRGDCPDGSDEMYCENAIVKVRRATQVQQELIEALMETRQSNNSVSRWGHDLPEIVTALFLTDQNLMSPENETGKEVTYEISLQLLTKLARNYEIETYELSLYVNVLLITCVDPRNFFSVDLVAELRRRVTAYNQASPFTILTLCNARDNMTSDDVDSVVAAFDARHRPSWTETQALATMALACLSNQTNLVNIQKLTQMTNELKKKQHRNGTVENFKITALVIQALLATETYKDNFDLEGAVESILQDVSDQSISILESYYVLPIFGFKSLVDINDDHCVPPLKTDVEVLMELRDKEGEHIGVQCSMFAGEKMDLIRTWKLKVPSSYTFYQVLETIGSLEPKYKVHYDVAEGKPYVTGAWKMVDNARTETYWFSYKQELGSTDKPKLVHESPVDIEVNEKEELILWYRFRNWTDFSPKSTQCPSVVTNNTLDYLSTTED